MIEQLAHHPEPPREIPRYNLEVGKEDINWYKDIGKAVSSFPDSKLQMKVEEEGEKAKIEVEGTHSDIVRFTGVSNVFREAQREHLDPRITEYRVKESLLFWKLYRS